MLSATVQQIATLADTDVGELIPAGDSGDMELEVNSGRYQLKQLKHKHKQILSLVAQGVDRQTISALMDITPEYVTMLSAMPICRAYLGEMSQAAGVQLEAMFVRSVAVIADAMDNGDTQDRLKAARLQMEATKRIGAAGAVSLTVDSGGDRLERLANRLIGLLDSKQLANGRTLDDSV